MNGVEDKIRLVKLPHYYDNVREEMLSYIPEGVARSIEFGCGEGKFSELVKKRYGAEIWAVEKHKESAGIAAGRLDNVINSEATASLDQIPEGYFDCVICLDFLPHLADPVSFLCSVKSKLRDGGVIVTSIANVRYYRHVVRYILHGDWDYKDYGVLDSTHLRFFTYNSIKKMFDQLEFEILRFEGINPTSSKNFRLFNFLLFNKLADMRYRQFASVVRP